MSIRTKISSIAIAFNKEGTNVSLVPLVVGFVHSIKPF